MYELGVQREISVAPNPVDVDYFCGSVVASFPPEDDAWNLVTVGWLIPRKDHVTLLRAFAQVVSRWPSSSLAIAGDGPLRGELESLAGSLGLSRQVRFLGRVDRSEVATLLAASHLYVHASRAETYGVSLVEAWASGLPVVTFDCGGVSASADEIGGRSVSERSASSLSEAICAELGHLSLARRLEIQRTARVRFDRSSVSAQLGRAYGGQPTS
jgi:glycosyltransferase involved in cell wall biosynthesis